MGVHSRSRSHGAPDAHTGPDEMQKLFGHLTRPS
jgi:hypothetical protein